MTELTLIFPDDMIAAAVGFWADHLRHGAIGDEKAIARLPHAVVTHRALDILRKPTDEAKVLVFEAALTRLLHTAPRDTYGLLSTGKVWLRTDYDAMGMLRTALDEANIVPIGKFPLKTWMHLTMHLGKYDPAFRNEPCEGFPRARGTIEVNGAFVYPTNVFEVWQSESEGSLSVCTPLEHQRHRAIGLHEADATPLYALRGTWEEVMSAHHAIQEWEPYVP